MKADAAKAAIRREKLRALCDARTQKAVATATGISYAQLGQWLTGDRNLSEQSARRIERALTLPEGYLDGLARSGDGEEQAATPGDPSLFPVAIAQLGFSPAREIPVIGAAQLKDDGLVNLSLAHNGSHGSLWFSSGDQAAYSVRCDSDALAPRVQYGEFVLIEPGRAVSPGDEVLIRTASNAVMICRLRYIRDGRIHLDSMNVAARAPIVLQAEDVEALHFVAAIVKPHYHRSPPPPG